MQRYVGIVGVMTMLGLAYLLSSHRNRISLRIVIGGIGLQVVLAWLLLAFPPAVAAFDYVAKGVNKVIGFADEGTAFIFGPKLMDPAGPWGFIFAVKVLPVIIFFASLMGVLYHLGIMQRVVASLAWVLRRVLDVTGAEALAVSANVFVGQTEAPLCVKPYVEKMTSSQLMALMVGGFATIAGSVLAAYVGILGGEDPVQRELFIKHLLTASVMSAPAAFVIAKIMLPETEQPLDERKFLLEQKRETQNVLDAAARGATDGLKLALNVAAMLVAFVALLALLNWPIGALGDWTPIAEWREANDIPPFSLQYFLGWLFRPLAWVMGAPWQDCQPLGSLMGEKIVATEFIAYLSLVDMIRSTESGSGMSLRSIQIATYALCGFANLPSIAIQIGGLTGIAPSRRTDFARLGLRAMAGGALASWMTASIAGLFLGSEVSCGRDTKAGLRDQSIRNKINDRRATSTLPGRSHVRISATQFPAVQSSSAPAA